MVSRAEQSHLINSASRLEDVEKMEVQLGRAADTLAELCGLLEEYGPRWYTEAHQERAESTLQLLRKLSKAV